MANRYPLIIDTADGNKIKELPADDNLYLRNNSITDVQDINALGIINAADIRIAGRRLVAQTFTDLTDTPNNYIGASTKFIRVNSAGTALEFATLSSLGNTTVNNLTVDSGDIFPLVNLTNKVGKSDKQFAEMHAGSFYGNLKGLDGTIVFDAATNRIPYAAIYGAPTSLSEFTNDMGFVDQNGLENAIDSYLNDSTHSGGSSNRLINGSNELILDADGTLVFPDGATINSNTPPSYTNTFATNSSGSTAAQLNSLSLTITDVNLKNAIIANPSNFTITFNGATSSAIASIVYQSGNNYLLSGTWPLNVNAFPITIASSIKPIYWASSSERASVKLFVMVEGIPEGGADIETQACEIIAVKGNTGDVIVSVYGLTYSGAAPLATFDGQLVDNRIEVTATAISTSNPVNISVHAIELTSRPFS